MLHEFALMVGKESVETVAKNMKRLLFATEALAGISPKIPSVSMKECIEMFLLGNLHNYRYYILV